MFRPKPGQKAVIKPPIASTPALAEYFAMMLRADFVKL
jgi:hypothetical protein